MISYSDKPTDAQLILDEAFITFVRKTLRADLLAALVNQFNGFEQMHFSEKLECLIKDNERYFGVGDALPIQYGPVFFNAYSGVDLTEPENAIFVRGKLGNRRIGWKEPLFADKRFPGSLINFSLSQIRESNLKRYLVGDTSLLHEEKWGLPALSELPIAFMVALVCKFINEHVISSPSIISAFVLGEIESIETYRYVFEPTEDDSGLVNGWIIRIHDVRPSQAFGKQLAEQIKLFVEHVESGEQTNTDYSPLSHFEPKGKNKPRATPNDTQEMVAFIDSLVDQGIQIGRGGDYSWEKVAAKLAERSNGRIIRTGKNLRDSYHSYKRRHSK